MRVFGITENNQVAGCQLASVYIRCRSTDFLDFALVYKTVQGFLPSNNCLRVPTRCIDCIGNELSICTLDIRKVVADIVSDETCTAQAVLLISGNIRCFARRGRTVCYGFFTRCACAIRDIGKHGTRCPRTVRTGLIKSAVFNLLLNVISRVLQSTENGMVCHIGRKIRSSGGKCRHRQSGNNHHDRKQGRHQLGKFLLNFHYILSFLF